MTNPINGRYRTNYPTRTSSGIEAAGGKALLAGRVHTFEWTVIILNGMDEVVGGSVCMWTNVIRKPHKHAQPNINGSLSLIESYKRVCHTNP